ncbi:MAG: hypothetical protein HY541_01090 [Deltaproteobacteria bacterium]|nr:hypothetical protein [Deltaproteobacteria bacterium]
MSKKKRNTPTEDEMTAYWDQHDATEALDLSEKNRVNLVYEPPVQSISLRLPVPLLTQIKRIAAGMDIAYQALIKVWLSEKAQEKKSAEKNIEHHP